MKATNHFLSVLDKSSTGADADADADDIGYNKEKLILKILRLCERSFTVNPSDVSSNSHHSRGGKLSKEEPQELMLARLFAYAHIRRGYHCLEILRQLRPRMETRGGQKLRGQMGVLSFVDDFDPDSGGGRQARGRHIYHTVITALYFAKPIRDNDWMVARNPANTADFILREMHRDGITASASTITSLLSLFTKAAHIAHRSQSRIDQDISKAVFHLQKAKEFLDNCHQLAVIKVISLCLSPVKLSKN